MRIAGFLQQVSGFAPNIPARSAAPQEAPTSPDQVSIASPNRYLQTPDGQQVRLPEQGCFQIGRHADCQVNLDGDLVSRRHCQGEFRNGQLWLKDCSSNGTFVNGKPLTQGEWKEIPADAQIGFGQSVHTMQLGSRGSSSAVLGPEGRTFDWPSEQSMVRVGSAEGSHLNPGQDGISDNHALMRKVDGKVLVMDTQSSGGTYLAGERLKPMTWTEVPKGTELAFGSPSNNWVI
jgi:pSer/pThr/pTyr-binding forkhead associated (FHA) protein